MMDFWIQASKPKSTGLYDADDKTLDEAIETVFPLLTERALLVWHNIHIPITYKYDISVIISDLLDLLSVLLVEKTGVFNVEWPSNTFHAKWTVAWKEDELTIAARWISVSGDFESFLNKTGGIHAKKAQFISEWRELLGRVLGVLRECGYQEELLSGMEKLVKVYKSISGVGVLYE